VACFIGCSSGPGGGGKDPSGSSTSASSGGGSEGGSGGSGAGGGTGGSAGASTGTGGQGGCASAADCPGEDTECGVRTCSAGMCGMLALKKAGLLTSSQVYGDCAEARCDGAGNVVKMDKLDDVYDDGNPCTLDKCLNGETQHLNQDMGLACGLNAKCDGNGSCVKCTIGGNDCPQATPICVATRTYKDAYTLDVVVNKCVPATCMNGMQDGTETDMDCGGACGPCDVGMKCNIKLDCKEALCDGVPGAKTCSAASCQDSQVNGDETYGDCGGTVCMPCTTGNPCKLPSDCASKVCANAKCAAPVCTDGVQNGDEEGVDCGGSCPSLCLP
jgi:hypothetical protein